MARQSYKTLVEDPVYGDMVPLARIAERHDLAANTVSARHNRGDRGMDLIRRPDESRSWRGQQRHAKSTQGRHDVITEALNSPGVRALVAPMAELGSVSASMEAV